MFILLHSSKTMRSTHPGQCATTPVLLPQAKQLADYLKTLSIDQLAQAMHISPTLASKTHQLWQSWNTQPHQQSVAIDSFVGDIFSGLRSEQLNQSQRQFAQQHLRLLSGLYGILKPLDGIMPYRLEMAYRFPKAPFNNLYTFWGQAINQQIPVDQLIVNVSSVEYSRVITKFRSPNTIITPQFLTINPKTGQPSQVAVHSKIARGAFARWLIISQTTNPDHFDQFSDLTYQFQPKLSSPLHPVYVCSSFGGLGLSQRLKEGRVLI